MWRQSPLGVVKRAILSQDEQHASYRQLAFELQLNQDEHQALDGQYGNIFNVWNRRVTFQNSPGLTTHCSQQKILQASATVRWYRNPGHDSHGVLKPAFAQIVTKGITPTELGGLGIPGSSHPRPLLRRHSPRSPPIRHYIDMVSPYGLIAT